MTDAAFRPLDRHTLLQRVEGDLTLLIAIVDVFLSRLPRDLEEIAAAVRSRDAATLTRSAHALKGSVATFSLGPVYRLSSRLEEIGTSGFETDPTISKEADILVRSLEEAARRMEIELRSIADEAHSGHILEDA